MKNIPSVAQPVLLKGLAALLFLSTPFNWAEKSWLGTAKQGLQEGANLAAQMGGGYVGEKLAGAALGVSDDQTPEKGFSERIFGKRGSKVGNWIGAGLIGSSLERYVKPYMAVKPNDTVSADVAKSIGGGLVGGIGGVIGSELGRSVYKKLSGTSAQGQATKEDVGSTVSAENEQKKEANAGLDLDAEGLVAMASGMVGTMAGNSLGAGAANWTLGKTLSWLSQKSDWVDRHKSLATGILVAGAAAMICGAAVASQCLVPQEPTSQEAASPAPSLAQPSLIEAAMREDAQKRGSTLAHDAQDFYKDVLLGKGLDGADEQDIVLAREAWLQAFYKELTDEQNRALEQMFIAKELEAEAESSAVQEMVPRAVHALEKRVDAVVDGAQKLNATVQALTQFVENREKERQKALDDYLKANNLQLAP